MLIGELSARSGVSPRSLRYYERHGLLEAERAANGYRAYDESTVARASTIHLLFGMGIPRDVVVSVLGCAGADTSAAAHLDLENRLPGVLDDLERRIAAMTSTRDELVAFLDRGTAPR